MNEEILAPPTLSEVSLNSITWKWKCLADYVYNTAKKSLCLRFRARMQMCFEGKFPEEEMLSQGVCVFNILVHTAKLPEF